VLPEHTAGSLLTSFNHLSEQVCSWFIYCDWIIYFFIILFAVYCSFLYCMWVPIWQIKLYIHRVSKNVPSLACYNFDAHEWISIFFGRNVTNKVGNQKVLYYATSNNLCCCTTWQNAETRKSHISLNWIVLHTQCTCGLSSWKKKLLSVMCLIASNICWGSKISH